MIATSVLLLVVLALNLLGVHALRRERVRRAERIRRYGRILAEEGLHLDRVEYDPIGRMPTRIRFAPDVGYLTYTPEGKSRWEPGVFVEVEL